MGNVVHMDLKLPKLLVHVLAIMANSYLKIMFSQKSGLNPPPPPPPPQVTRTDQTP